MSKVNNIKKEGEKVAAKGTHDIKLIEGEFTPDEAGMVLFTLISDKLRFHQIQVLSNKERFNESNPQSEQRIRELREAEEEVAVIMERARENGMRLELQGSVHIKMIKD